MIWQHFVYLKHVVLAVVPAGTFTRVGGRVAGTVLDYNTTLPR